MAPLGVSFHLLIENLGLVLSAILVSFDSNWFLWCPWAMSFFQKLPPASFCSCCSLMGDLLYVICHFSLVTFTILCLSLIFFSLTTMCFGVFLLGFILLRTLCSSWTWLIISFPMLRKFLVIICSNIFSGPFSLFSFWDPYTVNVSAPIVVPYIS